MIKERTDTEEIRRRHRDHREILELKSVLLCGTLWLLCGSSVYLCVTIKILCNELLTE